MTFIVANSAFAQAQVHPPAPGQNLLENLKQIPVDLELVLAVDVSSSMDKDEQKLQRDGYVAALRHPAILAAIDAGSIGTIAITYVEWGASWKITTVLDWTLLKTRKDAIDAANALASKPISTANSTSISSVLAAAATMLEENRYFGKRRVIDISGDGPNNVGPAVVVARADVLSRGIEINGLPILIKQGRGGFQIDNLDLYYRECVVGGPSAFVIPVYDKNRLASTILQKMVLEIAGRMPAKDALVHLVANKIPALDKKLAPGFVPKMDCMIGEKQLDDFMRSLGFE